MDPWGLNDTYADYFQLVQNQANIIYDYCVKNPMNCTGYGQESWGLTTSYDPNGISVHSLGGDDASFPLSFLQKNVVE